LVLRTLLDRTAVEGWIAVQNLLNALGIDLNLKAAPSELEQQVNGCRGSPNPG
jgi:hypothetical protein